MSEPVPSEEIEAIVGVSRHATRHYARAVSAEQTVYILHSSRCRETRTDLTKCPFSLALDRGIQDRHWGGHEDAPMRVVINRSGDLIPNVPGMRLAE